MYRRCFLWICFNAVLAHESEEDYDPDMIEWLKDVDAGQSRL
jgi:hypothetical protein